MTIKEFQTRHEMLKREALSIFVNACPKDTTHMSKSLYISTNPVNINSFYVSVDEDVVDYASYVLEDSDRNPNSGWDLIAAQQLADAAKRIMGGE